jgi:NTE family protein
MKKKLYLACFVFFWSHISMSQPTTYKNLVLEGGGIRGFAYVGSFEVLDSLGILSQVEKIGGSSAGALQATLLAIGYTPNEILEQVESVPLRSFNDGFFLGGLSRLNRKLGFYKGKKIHKWIEDIISAKTGDGNITFMQLHELTATSKYKDLYITGTDLTYRCLRIFSYEKYPNMRIKDALRISLSIPLYFEPLRIDDNGKIVTNKHDKNAHLVVDGGLLANFPIHMFDSTIVKNGESLTVINKETLGILLDKPEQLEYTHLQKGTYPIPTGNIHDYLTAVYQTIIDKPNPDKPGSRNTITVSHNNMSGRVRKISSTTIGSLVENGRQGVRLFFGIQ